MRLELRSYFTTLLAFAILVPAAVRVVGQAPRSVADSLPPSTLAHIEITAEPCSRLSGQLALARILAEPEVATFLRPLIQFIDQQEANLNQRLMGMTGLSFSGVAELLQGKLTFSLVGIRPLTGRRSGMDGDFLLTLDFAHAPELGATLVTSLERLLRKKLNLSIEEVRAEGRPLKIARIRDVNSETIVWAVHQNVLHIANYSETLMRFLALKDAPDANAQTLGNSKDFLRAQSHCRDASTIVFAYANANALIKVATREAPMQFGFIMKAAGIDALTDVAYSASLDGSAVRDRIWMGIKEKRGLMGALLPSNGSITSDQFVPKDTVFYGSGAFGLGAIWDQSKNLGAADDTGLGEFLAEFEDDIEAESGVALGDDVFAHLGNEIAYFVSMSIQSLVPDIAAVVEVKNGGKLIESISKLMEMGGLEQRSFEFADRKYHYFDLTDEISFGGGKPEFQFKVTWTLYKNWLLITAWPQSAKRLVARMGSQTGSLSTQRDYRELMAQLSTGGKSKGIQGRSYLDLTRIAGFILDNGTPMVQSFLPRIPNLPIELDWAAMPLTETITQHLFGVAGEASQQEGGYLLEYTSPIGVVPAYAVLLAGAAAPYAMVDEESMSTQVMDSVAQATLGIEAKRQRAQLDLKNLKTAIAIFSLREHRLPNESEWPKFMFQGSARHPEPYLDVRAFRFGQIADPWGNPYVYRKLSSRFFEVLSYGADGAPGGSGINADIKIGRAR